MLKHNKKRNVALVYEFLVRHLSANILAEDPQGSKRTLQIIRRNFSVGSMISREKELFDAIRKNRGVSEVMARRILHEVKAGVTKILVPRLNSERDGLVKEINHSFGVDFYSPYRLREYRLLASIGMLLESLRGKRSLSEGVELLRLEEAIVRYMSSDDSSTPQGPLYEKMDSLACAMAVSRFKERYGKTLNEGQRRLLGTYIRSLMSSDSECLRSRLAQDIVDVGRSLQEGMALPEVREDKVMTDRMNEAVRGLQGLDMSDPESAVQEVMLYHSLCEQLGSK